ncbi:uncharacterized protein LOC113774025 [Coffea eugenioides]|uniref:uncharacterized protein LOC113774025 n=1 Tax=Coffea eugenioides TaxID=49369 RepID=UPI000F60DC8E|nr:uncharacterized protein LOC113774025 [Coffea eugenioides]
MLLWQFDKLGAGWDEYCEQNITNEHHMLLLRHIGNLFFDVINFCELQQEVNLSWTVPLTNLHLRQDSRADPPIHEEIVTSSLQPHFSKDSSTSVCFYQSFHSADPYTLKIPRFVDYFLNEQKTTFIALRTGDNITEIGMKGKRLKKNWKAFILQHQLQHNDVLIFIPESKTVFTVLIFDSNGDEKIFPWYPVFHIHYYN